MFIITKISYFWGGKRTKNIIMYKKKKLYLVIIFIVHIFIKKHKILRLLSLLILLLRNYYLELDNVCFVKNFNIRETKLNKKLSKGDSNLKQITRTNKMGWSFLRLLCTILL